MNESEETEEIKTYIYISTPISTAASSPSESGDITTAPLRL